MADKFDAQSLVHRQLTYEHHGVKLHCRVIAAGYKSPTATVKGTRTPIRYIIVAPEGTPTAGNSYPSDNIEIQLGAPNARNIEWHDEDVPIDE